MGAFVLYPSTLALSPKVYDLFNEKGFDCQNVFNLNQHTLVLYKKQLILENNYYTENECSIFCVGTFIYKNNDYNGSLKHFLRDFTNQKISSDKIYGGFFILLYIKGGLYFFTDKSNIQNIYYDPSNGIISSSFLACSFATDNNFKLNIRAAQELLLTGTLMGPDTLVDNVFKYEPSINPELPGLTRINVNQEIPAIKFKSFNEAIDYQIELLNTYFRNANRFLNKYGVICGLTGGFDSRLLFFFLINNEIKFDPYSTWKKYYSLEFDCADKLSKSAGYKLNTIRYLSFDELDSKDFINHLENNFVFSDGMIRSNYNWIELNKSRSFLIKFFERNKINVTGYGGEQYRNAEFLVKDRYKITNWIWNEIIYQKTGNAIISKEQKHSILMQIELKVKRLLNIDEDNQYITRREIKRYYNEIYNSANRVMRNNIENQIAFSLSPFLDPVISQSAYNILPYLGLNFDFQIQLLKRSGSNFNNVMTDYNFSLNEKIPFKYNMVSYSKYLFGLNLYNRIYMMKKNIIKSKDLNNILEMHPTLNTYLDLLKELKLNIKLSTLSDNKDYYPLLLQLGIFIKKMNSSQL